MFGDDGGMRPLRSLTFVATFAAALLLAGCVPTETVEPSPEDTVTPTPTPSETPSPTPTPTVEAGTPVTITCEELVSLSVMYSFDPNFSLQPSFTPAAGTLAAEAVADGGVACQWVHQTSGVTIDLSVAQPPASALNTRMNDLVVNSNSVPTYGVEGYFQVDGAKGEAQAFPVPYWITAVSPAFFEPGDPSPIIAAMVEALG